MLISFHHLFLDNLFIISGCVIFVICHVIMTGLILKFDICDLILVL